MEPTPDSKNRFDHDLGNYLPEGFNKGIKFPRASQEYLDRVEGELAVYSQPGGRFKYSVVAGTRIYELTKPGKLGLAYIDKDGETHLALFPNTLSIDFPQDPEIGDRLTVTFESNDETKYLHFGIGGFKGIFFED